MHVSEIRYRNIQHFMNIPGILNQICFLYFPSGKANKKMMIEFKTNLGNYKWSPYFTDQLHRSNNTIEISLDWDIDSINMFLNYIKLGLNEDGLLKMNENHFEIVSNIFDDLGIDRTHPLYNTIIYRQFHSANILLSL